MDWLGLISGFLFPMLAKCLNEQSSENAQDYLAEHYNATTGRMDPGIVKDAMPATRRAIRKAHNAASKADRKSMPKYSKDDIRQITEDKLIEAMNATPDRVDAAFAAAMKLED